MAQRSRRKICIYASILLLIIFSLDLNQSLLAGEYVIIHWLLCCVLMCGCKNNVQHIYVLITLARQPQSPSPSRELRMRMRNGKPFCNEISYFFFSFIVGSLLARAPMGRLRWRVVTRITCILCCQQLNAWLNCVQQFALYTEKQTKARIEIQFVVLGTNSTNRRLILYLSRLIRWK